MKATFKITLKAARINVGLSQKNAAKQLRIDAATLRNYEKGKTSPTWDIVEVMEKLYKIDRNNINFFRNDFS